MNSFIRSATSAIRFVAFTGLLATAAAAHANTTHSAFADVAGAASTDGFNNLAAGRITTANLVAGVSSNVAGSDGDATFKRTSGTAYPASTGLYEWGGPRSTFEISIDAVENLSSITFQSLVNVSIGANNIWGLLSANNLPQLSFNGGNQLLAATTQASSSVAFTDMTGTPTAATADNPNYSVFTWDLSSITTPITSVRLTFATDAHAQGLAFQVDQIAVAAVPEPGTYAMMAGGLGLMGLMLQRRRRQR
jgi:hypothetical protein